MDSGRLHRRQGPALPNPQVPLLCLLTVQAYNIDVVAVVNDTVGTMMGCEPGSEPCEVGLVVGEPRAICGSRWGARLPVGSPDGVISARHWHQRVLHGGGTARGSAGRGPGPRLRQH